MDEDRLIKISYDFTDRTAQLVYQPDAEFEIKAIVEYVEDMSDGRAVRINIEDDSGLLYSLFRRADGEWGGIEHDEQNGL